MATQFVLSCVRRVLNGDKPSEVFACGQPGRPKDNKTDMSRGAKLEEKISNGCAQNVAINNLAADLNIDETSIRKSLRIYRERVFVAKLLKKIEMTWDAD
jgi:hypothetical protein